MGLLDRDIIPPGWEEHHRPVATGTMTAVCDIIAPGERASILDDAAETVAAAGVKCRVQQQNQGLNGSGPGQETTTREYLVTLPHDVGVEFRTGVDGHKIRITSANNPRIVGRVFDVKQVLHGSLVWETDLYCEDNQTQNERVNGL